MLKSPSQTLLAEVLEAHAGIRRWCTFSTLTAKVFTGGFLWGMKVFPLADTVRSISGVEVAGQARAAHMISEYVDVEGLFFPTQRRVFMRNQDGTLQFDKVPVSIDLSEFELSSVRSQASINTIVQ